MQLNFTNELQTDLGVLTLWKSDRSAESSTTTAEATSELLAASNTFLAWNDWMNLSYYHLSTTYYYLRINSSNSFFCCAEFRNKSLLMRMNQTCCNSRYLEYSEVISVVNDLPKVSVVIDRFEEPNLLWHPLQQLGHLCIPFNTKSGNPPSIPSRSSKYCVYKK